MTAPLAKLEIDRGVIETILTQQVSAAVVQQLGGTTDLVAKLVAAVLLSKVDPQSGNPSSYTNSVTLLQYTMESKLKVMLVEVVRAQLDAAKPELERLVMKSIREKGKDLAAKFIDALGHSASNSWNMKITFEPPKER